MFEIIYYMKNDDCPIFDFLKTLPKKDRAKILREIEMLQEFGLSLGMPHIKKMKNGDDIWELRIKQSSNSYRVFYFTLKDKQFVMLNAFQKKTQKTPKRELERAIKYKNDYLQRSD